MISEIQEIARQSEQLEAQLNIHPSLKPDDYFKQLQPFLPLIRAALLLVRVFCRKKGRAKILELVWFFDNMVQPSPYNIPKI